MANICGVVDYDSVAFQLKSSKGNKKLLSKIFFYDLFKRKEPWQTEGPNYQRQLISQFECVRPSFNQL